MQNGLAAVENSGMGSQKIKHRVTIWSLNSTSYTPESWKQGHSYFYTRVHSNIIPNSQKVEAAQITVEMSG